MADGERNLWTWIPKGLVSGLAVSILFVYFLDPVIRLTWALAIFVASHAYSGLIDAVYREAASARNPIEFGILIFGFAIWGTAIVAVLIDRAARSPFDTEPADDPLPVKSKPSYTVMRLRPNDHLTSMAVHAQLRRGP
jgi:hypothetical protein